MSRRRTQKKRNVMPDPIYDSRLIELIVRQIMRKGKKSLAYKIMYDTMTQIADTTQQDPLVVIEQAIRNATPLVEVTTCWWINISSSIRSCTRTWNSTCYSLDFSILSIKIWSTNDIKINE